jgi:hypothetical protein
MSQAGSLWKRIEGLDTDSNHGREPKYRVGIRLVYFQSWLITRIRIRPLTRKTARQTLA